MLRDWSTARDCWTGYGITLPPGDGEILGEFGVTCVRISTATGQEVVWAHRLCPTRARVVTVPFDPSRRFGEVVLHDGVPNGERIVQGQRYPVFDEIMLFAPSEIATLAVTVTAADTDDIDALLEVFARHDLGAEVLSSGRLLCTCCSEGSHAVDRAVDAGRQTVLIAADKTRATELLHEWRSGRPDTREWEDLHAAT
ncbi:hypothetical protein SAMN05444365_102226 [Micromonospora pattaloongensis]|uniref:Uncharacterized protein n=1 Tax=Micromonospora pattaloongensis TaxID=405436 RepID=A0A1H3JTD8_9ACTN|nr:hypothetical protein [Micromonospora pattaloongensis]SDY42544.1 hypothetical protein SAMN05444365_102226 [Micromonospora pattaloongensis]